MTNGITNVVSITELQLPIIFTCVSESESAYNTIHRRSIFIEMISGRGNNQVRSFFFSNFLSATRGKKSDRFIALAATTILLSIDRLLTTLDQPVLFCPFSGSSAQGERTETITI